MFSLLMSEILPPSSNAIPIITLYFMCVMIMSSISVIASVIVISLHFRNAQNYTMPVWVQKYICYYLAWMLRMKHPRYDLTWWGIRHRWGSAKEHVDNVNANGSIGNHHSMPLLHHTVESLPDHPSNLSRKSCTSTNEQENYQSRSVLDLTVIPMSNIPSSDFYENLTKVSQLDHIEMIRSELRTIISHLASLTRHAQRQEDHDVVCQDWKFVAMVVDRLCLVLFSIAMVSFTLFTLFSTPNFFKLK